MKPMEYDTEVVYTVETVNGKTYTGRFTERPEGGFWSMEILGQDERNAADWIDLNPRHIVAVYAAAGKAYAAFVREFAA